MVQKIDNGYGRSGFTGWWSKTSLTLIGSLLSLLIILCFSIVGYNFAADKERHQEVEQLKTCKVEKERYIADIQRMDQTMNKIYDKLDEFIRHSPQPHIHTDNRGNVVRGVDP